MLYWGAFKASIFGFGVSQGRENRSEESISARFDLRDCWHLCQSKPQWQLSLMENSAQIFTVTYCQI